MQNAKFRMSVTAGTQGLLILLLSLFTFDSAQAEIPEPDNILYGTIVLGTNIVTAARTDVVIEARRTPAGPAIANYRMGSNPGLGSYYVLRLGVESISPVSNTNASVVGDNVFIVVRDASGVQGQTTYMFPERGNVLRVDFGTPLTDADGNGLPDAWEIANFGSTGQNPDALNLNGQTTLANFIAGSAPNNTNTLFKVNVMTSGSQKFVSFLARRAEGAGYEGRSRLYALEISTNLNAQTWKGIVGYTNILGDNQTVTYQAPITAAPEFYRGRVSLSGP